MSAIKYCNVKKNPFKTVSFYFQTNAKLCNTIDIKCKRKMQLKTQYGTFIKKKNA